MLVRVLIAVGALAVTWPAFRWLDARAYRYADESEVRLRSHRWVLLGVPLAVTSAGWGQAGRSGPVAGIVVAAVMAVLVVVSAIDLDVHRLPDVFTWPLIPVAAVGLALVALTGGDLSAWRRSLVAGVLVGGIYLVLGLLGGFGWGDVKLAPTVAMLLGWQSWMHLIAGIFAGFLLGGLVGLGLVLIAKRSRKSSIPFGPFMVAGAWLLLAFPALAT